MCQRVRRVHAFLSRSSWGLVLLRVLGAPGVLWIRERGRERRGLLVYPFMCTEPGLRTCAYRTLDGGRRVHYLRGHLGVHWVLLECACGMKGSYGGGSCRDCINSFYYWVLPYMLVFVGLPSLHVYYACMVCWG